MTFDWIDKTRLDDAQEILAIGIENIYDVFSLKNMDRSDLQKSGPIIICFSAQILKF